jgi:microcompartment protein CcmL/EutN
MVTTQLINSPSERVLEIVKQRMRGTKEVKSEWDNCNHSAIGLIHGNPVEIIAAADIAQKAADVSIFELSGTCQFHFAMVALLGDVSSVDTAVMAIRNNLKTKK